MRNGIKHSMAIASFAFGISGLIKPSFLGRLTGASDDEARGLGFRDIAVGVGIYASPSVGLAQRALADVGDAANFARRKPAVVPVALLSAVIAAYGSYAFRR